MMFCILLVLLVGSVTAQSSSEGRRILCGRELAKAHFMYCNGAGASESSMELDSPTADLEGSSQIPDRFTYKMRRAMERTQFENRLVDTCCLKPCHIYELLSHC